MAEVKKVVKKAAQKTVRQAAKPREISTLSIRNSLRRIQSDNALLMKRKMADKKSTKVDLIVSNRLRVLLNQLDRFIRLDVKK